jgi:predicted transcriptional regulator
MSHTITVRLDDTLADWLEDTSRRTGRSQGEIIREQLERARSEKSQRRFMRLAGCVDGPRDLSSRKGFSKG